jgi:ABC-type nickel/cobalt efflux system permease component RcnA
VKRLTVLAIALAALAAPAGAQAHPLGNFTINRYSRIELSGDRIYVLYVLDMAEIPTFQARPEVAAGGPANYASRTAARLLRHVSLTIAGRPVALRELGHALAFPPGQAGLRTTRLEAVYASGPVPSGTQPLRYRDDNFPGRIGWKEIVARADSGARIDSASAPATSASDELRAYPKDLLQSPLDVAEATVTFSPGRGPGVPPTTRSGRALDARVGVRAVADSGFAALIGRDRLPVGVVLVSLLAAVFWGAAHALSPGHGKSIVAAYLVGTRGTRRDAVVLGVTVTVTHTIGVFALGLITLSLSQFVVPEDLYPWLNLISALLVIAVGLGVLSWRLRAWRRRGHHHDHHHGHRHHHGHDHHDAAHRPGGIRGLIGVGVSGGLIPCPTALVVLLAAISLHRIGYGLVLILAFSAGLAATMTGIGLIAVTAKRAFDRIDLETPAIRILPAISALAILGLGLAMTAHALPHVT